LEKDSSEYMEYVNEVAAGSVVLPLGFGKILHKSTLW